MTVRVVQFLDEDTKEAILEVSDDKISLIVFGYAYEISKSNQNITLSAFLTEKIVLEQEFQLPRKTDKGFFAYRITAAVTDATAQLVQLGDINMILDLPLPKDIPNGSIISFDVTRLDFLV